MRYETISVGADGPIATITLDRPERRNAVSPQLLDEFEQAYLEAGADDSVSVLIIRGAGPDFCAGLDVFAGHGSAERDSADSQRYVHESLQRRVLALRDVPKPVIAQVHGHCLGLFLRLPSRDRAADGEVQQLRSLGSDPPHPPVGEPIVPGHDRHTDTRVLGHERHVGTDAQLGVRGTCLPGGEPRRGDAADRAAQLPSPAPA